MDIAARVRSRWRQRGSGPFKLRYLKGPREDPVVVRAVAVAQSGRAAALAATGSADMRMLMERLGDRPADPHPLPSTMFDTEAEAVAGCATPPQGGRLLYGIARAVRPRAAIEVGTAHGYGAYYIASALADNGGGHLDTLEGMRVRVELARETVTRLGVAGWVTVVEGDFRHTLPGALRREGVDLRFVDGDKSVDLTRTHFEQALTGMSATGFIVFDDVNFSREIESLFAGFVAHPRVARAAVFRGRWALLQLAPAG